MQFIVMFVTEVCVPFLINPNTYDLHVYDRRPYVLVFETPGMVSFRLKGLGLDTGRLLRPFIHTVDL